MDRIASTERFFQPEISKVYWLASVGGASPIAAASGIPTRTELEAGLDITDEVADMAGFNVTSGFIAVPDLGRRFTRQIGGRTSADASSITFYGSLTGEDIRQVMHRLDRGVLVFADSGDAAGKPADAYPVEVSSVGKLRSVGDNAYRIQVGFAPSGIPVEDFELPAPAVVTP